MKKKLSRMLSAGICALLLSLPINAVAEDGDSSNAPDDVLDPFVVAIMEPPDFSAYYILSNWETISQRTFQTYVVDYDNELQIGDVIRIHKTGYYNNDDRSFENGGYIEYLGRAEELYADSIQELTVTRVSKYEEVFWTDADGTEKRIKIGTDISDEMVIEEFGYGYQGYMGKEISVGDKLKCVVGYYKDKYGKYKEYTAILEKTYQAEYVPGDVTGEGNVNLMDVISINRHIMIGEHLTPAAKKAADLNGDGKVTPAESLQILRYVVKLEDSLG